MNTVNRIDAVFTATLSAALFALGVTAFATVGREATAEATAHVTLPTVLVVGKRAAPATADTAATAATAAAVQSEGSVARKAS